MNVYFTNGTTECFFTAVFNAYGDKDALITADNAQLTIGGKTVDVYSENEKSARVQNAISKFDGKALNDILLCLRSCNPLKEQIAFRYIKLIMQYKSPVKLRLTLPEVVEFNQTIFKVAHEVHKFTGFIRFTESRHGALYAPYAPDNDITELLMPHFVSRLKNEIFAIHDVKRKIAGLYDGKNWATGRLDKAEIYLSENETQFEALWRKYYKAVTVNERPHEKQMKGSMPVRYWKFLPEKK